MSGNIDNLVSLADRSEEERKQIASMGGKASAEKREKRKRLAEELEAILLTESEKGGTRNENICRALIKKALQGDVRAFVAIRDTLGEKPSDNLTIQAEIDRLEGLREQDESIRLMDEYFKHKRREEEARAAADDE